MSEILLETVCKRDMLHQRQILQYLTFKLQSLTLDGEKVNGATGRGSLTQKINLSSLGQYDLNPS